MLFKMLMGQLNNYLVLFHPFCIVEITIFVQKLDLTFNFKKQVDPFYDISLLMLPIFQE